MSLKPLFDKNRCDGCGLCVTVCKCNALKMVDGVIVVLEVSECGWCGDCELVCATGALQCPFEIVTLESKV